MEPNPGAEDAVNSLHAEPMALHALHRAILESSPDAILTLDSQGCVLEWNPAAEATFGYLRGEAVGRELAELVVPPQFREVHRRALQRSVETGISRVSGQKLELVAQHRSGEQFPVEVSIVRLPLRDRTLFTGFVRDLRAQRVAAVTAQQQEALFRTLVEHSSDLIAVVDALGVIHYASPSVTRVLGYASEELVGSRFTRLVHPDDLSAVQDSLASALAQAQADGPEPEVRRFRCRHRDGSWHLLEAIGTLQQSSLESEPSAPRIVVNIRDATERERTRESLHLIASGARCLLWHAEIEEHGGVLIWRLQTADEDAAQRFLPVRKRSSEDYAEAWLRSCHPTDQEQVQRTRDQAVREGRAYSLEFRAIGADGAVRWIQENVRVTPTGPGAWRAVGVCSDVTELKEAEEAAHASEARFRRLAEHATDAIVIHDLSGRVIDVNASATRDLGYSREELLAGGVTLVETGVNLEDLRRMWAALEPGEPFSFVGWHRRKDGTTFPAEVRVVAFEEDGRRLIMGSARDISHRIQADTRASVFRELGERLNQTTNRHDAARVVLEMADRLLGWDSCWLDLIDTERRSVESVIMMDEVNGKRIEIPQTLTEMRPGMIAWRAMHEGPLLILKDQAMIDADRNHPRNFGDVHRPSASILCVPIFPGGERGGEPIGALSIQSYRFNAYTEEDLQTLQALSNYCSGVLHRYRVEAQRLRLEEELRQAQKMEAVGRLAGGVAHDFNNMLAVITGYTDLTLSTLDPAHPIANSLREIRKAGERAASLTRQLLAFSRKQLVKPQDLDLGQLVRSAHTLLRRLIGEDVELVTLVDSHPGLVRADPGQMEQVLFNLAVNARDAMPQGGKLVIQVRFLDGNEEPCCALPGTSAPMSAPANGWVLLSVTDTGCGMDEETLAHIWEPFFTTKGVGEGTGLGLATVYGIVTGAGGRIEVESAPGKGTTFRICLPRKVSEAAAGAAPKSELPAPKGVETILVTEDEPMLRSFISSVLTMQGYTVIEAMNGNDALRICRQREGKIDLLLTDVVMPGQNGRELAESIAESYPGIRILFMSGYTEDAILRRGVSTASADFIQKPFTPAALARKVRDTLDHR